MLTEQRYEKILNLLNEKKSITVNEVKELLQTSESTVRRDITALDNAGKLKKVFGGAVALKNTVSSYEPTVAQKCEVNVKEKRRIAKYAASLIENDDFVYLDAGTTTGYMIEYLPNVNAAFVTNAVEHAKKLAVQKKTVLLIGGQLKSSTEAVVGNYAMEALEKFHFTKGFFGTNGITKNTGYTTPDTNEALVKKAAMLRCSDCYVLADYSKFDKISPVTFEEFGKAVIITNQNIKGYENYSNIKVVK